MNEYKTINGVVENTIIINRSKFITTLFNIKDSDEAQDRLNEIRKKYYDATHNVYCYICDINGSEIRFSDDGEPQGTSAQPALEVLKRRNLVKILAVITRYFGGIKLGSNGLVSAYSKSVSEAVDKAEILTFKQSKIISFNADYSNSKIIDNLIKDCSLKILSKDYQNNIAYETAISLDGFDSFLSKMNNIFSGNFNYDFLREDYINY